MSQRNVCFFLPLTDIPCAKLLVVQCYSKYPGMGNSKSSIGVEVMECYTKNECPHCRRDHQKTYLTTVLSGKNKDGKAGKEEDDCNIDKGRSSVSQGGQFLFKDGMHINTLDFPIPPPRIFRAVEYSFSLLFADDPSPK